MARDLIPPPSPAGRPQTPDGTPNLVELPPEPARSGAEPAMASPPPGPSQFRNRFGFLLGALGGVFIAVALVAVIVVADRGGKSGRDFGLAPNWSRWQPSDKAVEGGAQQIAAHVAAEYKHPDGKQLVQIKAAVLPDEYDLTVHSSTITDITGNRLVYTFDGLGPNRQIEGGKPSTTRAKVIHREALELALYTFRYLPDAESITMLLPPPPPTEAEKKAEALATAAGQTPNPKPLPTLFYRPGDLKPQLQVPLGQTIGTKVPSTDSFSGPEADNVETLTLSNRFLFSQTGNYKFVLDRPTSP
jgi:hypothetical protein